MEGQVNEDECDCEDSKGKIFVKDRSELVEQEDSCEE